MGRFDTTLERIIWVLVSPANPFSTIVIKCDEETHEKNYYYWRK